MKKQDVLKQLVDLLYAPDNPEGEGGRYTLDDFIGYLNSHYNGGNISMRKISGEEGSDIEQRRKTSDEVSILLVLMYRYARGYIRKALKGSLLQTADEFSFLITLMTFSSLKKSELINRQVTEKTSGSEIIRRLVKAGLVSEFRDEADHRAVRVSATGKGRSEIFAILPRMNMVSEIVKGNLNKSELNTLAFLLRKLDYFHHDIHQNHRLASLDEIGVLAGFTAAEPSGK